MTDTTAMLPCPFCGAAPMIGPWKDAIDQSDTCPTAIECGSGLDDCRVNPSVCDFDRADAIAAWNRRAALAGQADAVAWRAWKDGRDITNWLHMPVSEWALLEVADGITVEYAYATQPAAAPVDALRDAYKAGYRQGAYDYAATRVHIDGLNIDASESANTDPALAAIIAPASIGAEAQEGK